MTFETKNKGMSLRVDSGIRKIEVNDAGEYIEVSVNDAGLMARFAEMVDNLDAKLPELEAFDKEIEEQYKDITDVKQKAKAYAEVSKKQAEVYSYCMEELDRVFGKGTCRKVFGENVIADDFMILSFLDQMKPILMNIQRERADKIKGKYARRTGAMMGV